MFRNALFALFALISFPAFAESSATLDHTKATLIASQTAIKAGGTTEVGLLLEHDTGWHSYWQNPGDAGIPTTLNWILPEGFSAGDTRWPTPQLLREQTLAVYGYKDKVLLPVTITAPANAQGEVTLKLEASWLVCLDICIPESATLELTLPVRDTPEDTPSKALFTQNPIPKPADRPLIFENSGDQYRLRWHSSLVGEKTLKEAYFFPREENLIQYPAAQKLEYSQNEYSLTLERVVSEPPPLQMSGILAVTYEDGAKAAFDVIMQPKDGGKQGGGDKKNAENSDFHKETPYFLAVLFAFIGGVILNLMPCVLPVLSLKALAVVKKAGHDRKMVVRQALAYTAGILVAFALVAGILIGLQQGGEAVGWGFQMQSPAFVGAVLILLFVIGLNLSGMFELPVLFGNALAESREHRLRGSFFTGVLAAAVATPCTAPFMATAVGVALTLSPLPAIIIFLAMGLGLALPFLLIALCPPLLRLLPRPGAWMETFKQFLAFPMYASVVWLLWVLTLQVGADGLLIALVGLLALTFIIWLKKHCRDSSIYCRISHLLLLLAVFALTVQALSMSKQTEPVAANAMTFSQGAIDALRAEGKPLFVDATAAWCITCQVNKRVALDTTKTKEVFEKNGVTLMIADWTLRNPEITAWLTSFGYKGVPLNVYYPAGGGEPIVLPQLLTQEIVIQTIEGEKP